MIWKLINSCNMLSQNCNSWRNNCVNPQYGVYLKFHIPAAEKSVHLARISNFGLAEQKKITVFFWVRFFCSWPWIFQTLFLCRLYQFCICFSSSMKDSSLSNFFYPEIIHSVKLKKNFLFFASVRQFSIRNFRLSNPFSNAFLSTFFTTLFITFSHISPLAHSLLIPS